MSEAETQAKAVPFADSLAGMRALAGDPDYVVRVFAEARCASTIFGTDFTHSLLAHISRIEKERDEARAQVIAFGGPHAVRYAEEFGLAAGELHPVHYDILERCGARMDDFRRAALASARGEVPPQAEAAEVSSPGEHQP